MEFPSWKGYLDNDFNYMSNICLLCKEITIKTDIKIK